MARRSLKVLLMLCLAAGVVLLSSSSSLHNHKTQSIVASDPVVARTPLEATAQQYRFLEEEAETEKGEDEDEEELSRLDLTCIVGIVLLLIGLTMGFEALKEHLEESIARSMEPILEKLFGELTILGFLATIVFGVHQSGGLTRVALAIGQEPEELAEYVEYVHYTIFCVMVIFVLQVLILVQAAAATEAGWTQLEHAGRAQREAEKQNTTTSNSTSTSNSNSNSNTSSCHRILTPEEEERLLMDDGDGGESCWTKLCSGKTTANQHSNTQKRSLAQLRDTLIYHALRNEFLLERSPEAPFCARTPPPREKNNGGNGTKQYHNTDNNTDDCFDANFDFARYLGLAQIHMLTHIVEVKNATWIVVALLTVCVYGLALAVRESLYLLAWAWIALGWMVLIFNVFFERHLMDLRTIFLPRRVLSLLHNSNAIATIPMSERASESLRTSRRVTRQASRRNNASTGSNNNEQTPLFDNANNTNLTDLEEHRERQELPIWCDFAVEDFQRQWWASLWVSGTPNRQQCFFWLDRHGPNFYLHILQLNLIYSGVYAGLLVLAFLPKVWTFHALPTFFAYLVLAILPGIGMTTNKQRLVGILTEVCSVGSYRKPQVIADVRREAKTAHTVRTFLVFHKMKTYMEGRSLDTSDDRSRQRALLERLSAGEQAQIAGTFHSLDADGSGSITNEELIEFLGRMGMPTTDDSVHQLIDCLDVDGNGQITREEFLLWYVDAMTETMSMHDRATQLFRIFDANANGEITIGDFKAKFDALQLGFSVDEIGSIVNELDHDRSGSVCLHEFEYFLERYYPKELLKHDVTPTDPTNPQSSLDTNGRQARHGSYHRH